MKSESKATLQDKEPVAIKLKGDVGMELVYALPLPHYQGYFATTCGRIVSYNRSYNGTEESKKKDNPIFLKEQVNPINGYLSVGMARLVNGKRCQRTELVHRLVALTFFDEPPNYESYVAATDKHINSPRTEVNHKDCNKTNNKVANLEWVCSRENQQHFHVMKNLDLHDRHESNTDKVN